VSWTVISWSRRCGRLAPVLCKRWGQALRCRLAGGGSKPPRAAPVKSRGGERRGKDAAKTASGADREGEWNRTLVEASKCLRWCQNQEKVCGPGISRGDTCLLPRRHPAWRGREHDPGSCAEQENPSSWNPRARTGGVEGVPQAAGTARGRVPVQGTGADRPVVVMMLL